eukprot:COSAG06_NODE_20088_length_809_cov_1.354930_1_plen_245_part_01
MGRATAWRQLTALGTGQLAASIVMLRCLRSQCLLLVQGRRAKLNMASMQHASTATATVLHRSTAKVHGQSVRPTAARRCSRSPCRLPEQALSAQQADCEGALLSDIECEGEWRTCSSRCEVASERVWREVWAPSGAGAACPTATDCEYGEGSCEAPIDCEGSWSVCQEDCSDKVFSVSMPASGRGGQCQTEDGQRAPCHPGEGACPQNIECEGAWSECEADCSEKVFTITVPAAGTGSECSARDG